ncbi:LysR family transcriptional regulator [Actinokineospora soli]|uniref:LysR family transcriptional regulator n=1 Tax=Actinokineospora soli TaxID=1048753 RepID=A0ABW2TPJ7_9PSEU
MELELRHLRTVAVIAETGSLTKASVVLGLSQPALSIRLKRMEEEIGAPLFTRGPTGVELTAVGEFVLLRARAVLAAVGELRRGAVQFAQRAKPVITVGGSAGSVLLGLAERIGAHLPAVDVRLTMEYSPLLLRDLVAAGQLDLVTTVDYPGFATPAHEALACEVVEEEPVFVAVPATDPLAALDAIPLADLADRCWAITPPDGAGWPDCFYISCAHHGFTPEVRYTTPNADSIRALVAAAARSRPCSRCASPTRTSRCGRSRATRCRSGTWCCARGRA